MPNIFGDAAPDGPDLPLRRSVLQQRGGHDAMPQQALELGAVLLGRIIRVERRSQGLREKPVLDTQLE